MEDNLLTLTSDIVVAHVGNNSVAVADMQELIKSVHMALTSLGVEPQPLEEELVPAVAIRSSVKPEYIVCLEDGRKMKTLARYIRTRFDLTPDQYRARWKLPADYPMTAPAYSARRRELAKSLGLGRKPKPQKGDTQSADAAAPKTRASRKSTKSPV